MYNPNDARNTAKEILLKTILEEAENLFKTTPDLVSFGWQQFTTRGDDKHAKKFYTYHSVNTPNINGNPATAGLNGLTSLRVKVTEMLKQFDVEALLLVFGDDSEVCLYRDLSFEISKL